MRFVKPILLILSSTLACSRAMEMLAAEHADTVEMVLVDGVRYEGDLIVLDDTPEPISRAAYAEQLVISAMRYEDLTPPMVLDDTGDSYPPPAHQTRPTKTSAQTEWLRLVLRHIAYQTSLGRRERATAGITDARPRGW